MLLVVERCHSHVDGLADGGTLGGHDAGVDGRQEQLGGPVVGGEGQLLVGVTGEDDDADAVALQPVDQVGDGHLGALQPVGTYVFGQHRVGDVEHQHQVDTFALDLLQLGAHLRVYQADHQEEEGDEQQEELHQRLAIRYAGHQHADDLAVAETLLRPALPPVVHP